MHYNIKPIKLECELIFPNGLLLQPFYQTRGVQFKALLQPLQECNYSANSIKMMTWGNINHVLALPPPQTLDPQVSSNLFSKVCTKGRLISKCPVGVIKSPKKPTNFFPGFLPQPLKRGQIKKECKRVKIKSSNYRFKVP